MRKLILGICVFVGVPAISQAGPITVGDFTGVFVGYFSPLTTGESRAQLGSSLMSNGSGISPAIDGLTFEAYCVDILGPIFDPGTPQPPATFDATAASMQTWNKYGDALPVAGSHASYLYNTNADTIADDNDNVGRTALQMAIWNVLYDADFTVDTGAFRVNLNDVAVRNAANDYLLNLSLNLPLALASDATWLQLQDCSVTPCRDVQDFIGPGTQVAPVPEPATMSLFAVGVAAVAARRVRSRRLNTGRVTWSN
jgi:PEP-CTERM motif-containing protein